MTKEQIAAITSLSLVGKENREIAVITDVVLHSVQRWTKKIRDVEGADPPLQKKRPGRPRVTSVMTLKVMKHQMDSEPHISAKELKEKNPRLLHSISVCTIQISLQNEFKFQYHAPEKLILTLEDKRWVFFHPMLRGVT